MKNQPNLTREELRGYLLAFFRYTMDEITKIIFSLYKDAGEFKLSDLIPDPFLQFLANLIAERMFTQDANGPLVSLEDRDDFVKIFYQCFSTNADPIDEEELAYINAMVEARLEQEMAGEGVSSLNCGQAWAAVEASAKTAATNGISLCDPRSLQNGWNESIRVKYPTKELYIKAQKRAAALREKNPHSFSVRMKAIEIMANRAFGK